MEVLIALLITSIVLIAAFLSFRSSLDLGDDISRRQEDAQMVRMVLRQFRNDVLSSVECPVSEKMSGKPREDAEVLRSAFAEAFSESPGETTFELCTLAELMPVGLETLNTEGATAEERQDSLVFHSGPAGLERWVRYVLRREGSGLSLHRLERMALFSGGDEVVSDVELCGDVMELDVRGEDANRNLSPWSHELMLTDGKAETLHLTLRLRDQERGTRSYETDVPLGTEP